MFRATDLPAMEGFRQHPAGCPFDNAQGMSKTKIDYKNIRPAPDHHHLLIQENGRQTLFHLLQDPSTWSVSILGQDHECGDPV
jgi:hypothetical protein